MNNENQNQHNGCLPNKEGLFSRFYPDFFLTFEPFFDFLLHENVYLNVLCSAYALSWTYRS